MAQPLTSALALTPPSRLTGWLAAAWRYGLATSGPIATSGAHFLASLLLVRNLPAFQFGLFSFVLVIVPFCMSIVAALLVLPVNSALGDGPETRAFVEATCLKVIPALTALAGIIVLGFLVLAGAPAMPALLLAGFGAVLTYRWFARCLAFVKGSAGAAIASDLVYAGALMTGLGALMVGRHVELVPAAGLLLAVALIGLLPFGTRFFRDQITAITRARIGDYRTIFRDLTRWSLLGVILTEVTVNAHAYLVTFVSGPGPFALLAVGQILLRPASLMQSALPDLERPGMTRAMAARDWAGLAHLLRDFRLVLIAAWLGSVMLAAAILTWAPHLLLKKGYAMHDVLPVTLITAAIMLVRSFRTPPATFMQAAGAFKPLVGISLYSSAISIVLTLAFLLTLGPIASLCGILAGEVVILFKLTGMVREWKTRHG